MGLAQIILILSLLYFAASAGYFFLVVTVQGKRFDREEPTPASILPFLEPATVRYDLKKQELRQAI